MKKFYNILLICALVLVVLGNLLYWGAKGYRYIKRNDLEKNIGTKQYELSGEIQSVNISAQCADIEVKTADSFKCYVENMDISKTEAYVSNGVLYVKACNNENMNVLGWNVGNFIDPDKQAKLIVYMPDTELQNLKIDLGTGSINADTLRSTHFVLQLGVGSLSINNLDISGNGAIQTGAVNTKIYSLQAGNFSVSSGAGDIDVKLTGAVGEYDIKASGTVGRIDIFNSYKIGIKADMLHRGDGFRKLTVENGAGTVKIR